MFGFNQQPAGYGGPVLTRHAQKLQWLAGGQLLVSGLLFVFGIAVLALIVETTEGATVEKSNNYLWSTGLPGNAFMPMISGAMGLITGFLGWRSIRVRSDVKSEALRHGYHIMGIIQLIFFDLGTVYYSFLFISRTVEDNVGNGIYVRQPGTDLPTDQRNLVGVAAVCGTLSIINLFLYMLSSSINCMCYDPFIVRYTDEFSYAYRPRVYQSRPTFADNYPIATLPAVTRSRNYSDDYLTRETYLPRVTKEYSSKEFY